MRSRVHGMRGLPLVECINQKLVKWRVRWDVRPYYGSDTHGNDGFVTFVEAEFLHKPSPEEVEAAVSGSGVDALDGELEEICMMLGYGLDEFERRYEK